MAKNEVVQMTKPDGFDTMTKAQRDELSAQVLAGAVVGNATVLASFTKHLTMRDGPQTLGERTADAMTVIQATVRRVKAGDMGDMEAMLAAQALTLGKMFEAITLRAQANMAEHPEACRDWLNTALRTQAACRATIETLSEVKNPRSATFIRAGQANVTSGPQQVNNATAAALPTETPAHAPESQPIPSNELLRAEHGKGLE